MGLVFSEVVSLNLRLLSPTIPLDCNLPDKVGPKPPLTLDSPPHPPTASVHAESVAASRVEQALSEVASSLSSYQPKPGPHQAWLLQIQIWLLTAQLYIKYVTYCNEIFKGAVKIMKIWTSEIFPDII